MTLQKKALYSFSYSFKNERIIGSSSLKIKQRNKSKFQSELLFKKTKQNRERVAYTQKNCKRCLNKNYRYL